MRAEEDYDPGLWKHNLYLLQEKAPKPRPVLCDRAIEDRPSCYGDEFHGCINRSQAEQLLRVMGNGAYLVRTSQRSNNAFTLCMMFDDRVLNYKLFNDGYYHFVGDKRFETVNDLVADGLISMYVDKHAADYVRRMADEAVYEESPYVQHQTSADLRSICTSRSHNFTPFTFRLPHYCDYCRNFLWGMVQQGVRCDDCGFAAHKKCSERTLNDCRPEARYLKRMFGVELSTLCMAHQVSVAPVMSLCMAEVERRGLLAEGIYRVSGSHDAIERLRRLFDTAQTNSPVPDLTGTEDIHTIAGLLKLFLRLLPQQLVTLSVYCSLLNAYNSAKNSHQRARACRKALAELDESHLLTLSALMAHLRRVAEHSAINKMTTENLATIFSPTLFCTGPTPALPQQQHMLLNFLISMPKVFPTP